jgi:SAM-dependent MidA family methyltransferase
MPYLPEPDAAAREHSARVVAAVCADIARAGGWISFARYMHEVLYAPGLGYYVAGARKFGAAGDFVTSPELTPLFAQALAVQVAPILAATKAREFVEFGAGSGALAADLLLALDAHGALPSRYAILDVSPDLRERQRATIARRAPDLLARVEWLEALPAAIEGVVLMNEVLDAIPPHVVARSNGEWFERGVSDGPAAVDSRSTDGVTSDATTNERIGALQWVDRPLADAALLAHAQARFPAQDDYTSEINPAAEALIQDTGRRLRAGALLVIDYGFPQAEFYHPQRSDGTLMGHYRHHAHADPFLWPGLSDLTAHIDFTAIAQAGERAGLELAGYTSQAAFLLGCGILDRLREQGVPTSMPYLREASAVQKLTSPAEMGELFKVLAMAKDIDIAWPGFALGDRSHRL